MKNKSKKKLVKKAFKSPELLEQRIAPGMVGGGSSIALTGSGSGGCVNNHNINNHNINNHNVNNHNVNNTGSGSFGSGSGSGSALPPAPPVFSGSQGFLPGQ